MSWADMSWAGMGRAGMGRAAAWDELGRARGWGVVR